MIEGDISDIHIKVRGVNSKVLLKFIFKFILKGG